MAARAEGTPVTISELYPDVPEDRLRAIRAMIDGRHVPEIEGAAEAVIMGGHFDEEGNLDMERLEAYRRLETELADSKGKLVVLASGPASESDTTTYKLSVCRLDEDRVIDGRHGRLAADRHAIVEAAIMRGTPFLIAHGEHTGGGEELVGRQHDVAGLAVVGRDDERATEVMPAGAFPEWLERAVDDPRMRYVLYAELCERVHRMGHDELLDVTVPGELEPYLVAERAALDDYREFYGSVSSANRGFVRNGLTRGNLQPLIDKRTAFAGRERELKETHDGIVWRLERTVLQEMRGWPHVEFDSDGMYQWEVSEQLSALKHEAEEMERRIEVVDGQSAAVAMMERALVQDGADA